jgi:hypothetical protein
MNPAVGIFGFAEMGKNLVTHSTGLERAARLDILQLKENAASSSTRESGRLDERSLNPWRLEVWLVVFGGRNEASHSGGVEVDKGGEGKKKSLQSKAIDRMERNCVKSSVKTTRQFHPK